MSLMISVISNSLFGFDWYHRVFQILLFWMWIQPYILWFNRIFSLVQLPLCYFRCGSNRLCTENSLEVDIRARLHPYIIKSILSHVFIIYFIIWFLEGSLESHQSSLTILSSNWCHTKAGLCYFAVWRIITGTKGWCMGTSLWNWLSAIVLSGWSSPKIGFGLVLYVPP